MRTATTTRTGETCYVPEREDVDGLKVGDRALNPFGKFGTVSEITARGTDINGRRYVCFYVSFGSHDGKISASMKEGERIAYACKAHAREMDEAAARAE